MFKCPICNKDFNTLEEYAKHITEENAKAKTEAKARAEKERLAKIKDMENDIKATYEKLKNLVNEYNKVSQAKYLCELGHYDSKTMDDKTLKGLFSFF